MSEGNGHNGTHAEEHDAAQEWDIRAATTQLLQRIQFAQHAGLSFRGGRDLYEVLGYDRKITTAQYRTRYLRGGLAGRIIDAPCNATWRGEVELIEDLDPKTDTEFEKAWKQFDTLLNVQQKFLRVDKLSTLSTFAVLLIGADGDLSTELPRGNKPEDILFLTPFSGGGGPGDNTLRTQAIDADCSVKDFEVDVTSRRFGLPKSYQLRRTDITSPAMQRPVHWSRIVHIAENLLWDDVYGMPALERVWNLLDDLDKVTGGGAEAFWLRANQGLLTNIDKDLNLPDATAAKAALKEQSEEYKHQLTRFLITRGVDVKTLGSDVANFASPADAIITQIAGAKSIPKRILVGSEMGELASSQDRDNWKDQVIGRQGNHAGPNIVRPLVDRLIEYGYLPTPKKGPTEYIVAFAQIDTLTEEEKSTGAKTWSETKRGDGGAVFTDDEIRDKWYGMEPLTPEQKEATAPPAPPPPAPGGPGAGGDDEAIEKETALLAALEAAIESNDIPVIDAILGTRH